MTDAEFRAFLRYARAELDRDLAELEAIDTSDWSDAARAELEERRRGYVALRDSMAEPPRGEGDATESIARLMPGELAALRTRH
jgi:hypothetical protein